MHENRILVTAEGVELTPRHKMTSVEYHVDGDIAVIEVNNPPVNALSLHVREGLENQIGKANADRAISAIVVIGRATFLAGADIKEFKDGTFYYPPTIVEIGAILENSKKPIVAAIAGFALGGGFEVAICCHYRIALPNAQFGFPEVDLGILPAATGTQRFPRLVGLKHALDIIPTGRRISASEAQSMGAVDKIVAGDLLAEAKKFAKSVAKQPFDHRRVSRMTVKDASNVTQLRDEAVRKAQMKFKGMLAPLYCIKSVLAAAQFPFEEGLMKELEYANLLFSSGQSRALQYAFFAQRAAVKWNLPGRGSYKTVKPCPLSTGAVIGAGTMGSGIAMAMLNAGMPVLLLEKDEQLLRRGMDLLKSLYMGSVKLGKMSEDQTKACMQRVKPTMNYADLRDVDVVVEAVFEHMAIKKEVFRKLDQVCKPDALLCSNTSSLDIDEIASATSRPEKVIGTHFFVPAYYMRLLENVYGTKTSAETIATAQAFGVKLGKVPVLVGNCNGFAANRMRGPQVSESGFMVEEGCLPHEVDQVLEDFGMPLGNLKVSDLSGLDVGVYVMRERAKAYGVQDLSMDTKYLNGSRVSMLGYLLANEGRLGRKSGSGFYMYEKPNAKQPYNDPWIEKLLVEYSKKRGIQRRRIPPQEIIERQLYSCINEGFKILEEGICMQPEEIDTLWVLGFGWPRYMGGPMFYANMVGLDRVYERVCYYYDKHPTTMHWQPSNLLRRLATKKVPFKQWSEHIKPIGSQL